MEGSRADCPVFLLRMLLRAVGAREVMLGANAAAEHKDARNTAAENFMIFVKFKKMIDCVDSETM